jgi:hypothetical protein
MTDLLLTLLAIAAGLAVPLLIVYAVTRLVLAAIHRLERR